MTLIAGIVGRIPEWTVPREMRRCLTRSMSRRTDDRVLEIDRAGAYFAKVDIGAFGSQSSIESPDGALTIITGDPLLSMEGRCADRRASATAVHEAGGRLSEVLGTSRGVFSGASYDPGTRLLALYTDKLGLRPIYYTITDEYIVFASALRILESVPNSRAAMDARA